MLRGKRLTVVILWALSLIIVAGFAHAQKKPKPALPAPVILSGNDIGFSVHKRDSFHGQEWVDGTLVVKIDGEWVAASLDRDLKIQR
jgi:hypothetical protein